MKVRARPGKSSAAIGLQCGAQIYRELRPSKRQTRTYLINAFSAVGVGSREHYFRIAR